MFGIRFVKFEPGTYVMKFKSGKIVQEGEALSFFYYAPTTSLVSIPVSSIDAPFIFSDVTSDFQEVTVQGQITYRIADPKKISSLLNYTIHSSTLQYISDDPEKLSQRIINSVHVITKNELQRLSLKNALKSSEALVAKLQAELSTDSAIQSIGIEILGVSVLAIKPTPETAKALEAETRELILRESDQAIFLRRNAAVEQERLIKENELNTEIAVETKNREIMETKMEAEKSAQAKRHQMQEADLQFHISQEQKNKEWVALKAENSKTEADAHAYATASILQSFEGVNPAVLQVLSAIGMNPDKLIALAFQELAGNAEKIGQLHISPDLLNELIRQRSEP